MTAEERLAKVEFEISTLAVLVQDLLAITHRVAPAELEAVIRRRRLHIQGHTTGRLPMRKEASLAVFEKTLQRLERVTAPGPTPEELPPR